MSSTVAVRSGNAVRYRVMSCAIPSGPGGTGGLLGSWLTAPGAKSFSHRIALPVFKWSCQKWRTAALFSSADIIIVLYIMLHVYSCYPLFFEIDDAIEQPPQVFLNAMTIAQRRLSIQD